MKFKKLEKFHTFHWKEIEGADLCGKFEMPQVMPIHHVTPQKLVPFHMICSDKQSEGMQEKWVHFYIDDYQFERLWNTPGKYLQMLQKFAGVISPDYSMYLDMPRAQQIWNCWRNRVTAYWMQKQGIPVICNVGWSDAESLAWAFDGVPEHSVLAVTTQGCWKEGCCEMALLNGMHELVRQKKPEKILVYGKFPEQWKERMGTDIEVIRPFARERWGG